MEGLYPLQDKILKIVNSLNNEFYLTGGTALNRFYHQVRISEDLDLFMVHSVNFRYDFQKIFEKISSNLDLTLNLIADERDFKRIIINNCLQVDFVNDNIYKEGGIQIINGIKIDNIINILTNKLIAILNRDEPKDICDLITIRLNNHINWKAIISIAQKKELFTVDFFIQRLISFPIEWLDFNIKYIDNNLPNLYKAKLPEIIRECLHEFEGNNH